MLIKVKVGKVEIEYSEPTESTDYPKCTSRDKVTEVEGCTTKHDLLIKTIRDMVNKAADVHNSMEV